jgi:hypothetical protein
MAVVRSLRQVIQDLVAPARFEVAYGKAGGAAAAGRRSVMKTLDAFRAEMRSEFAALRAGNQAEVFRQLLSLSERVTRWSRG